MFMNKKLPQKVQDPLGPREPREDKNLLFLFFPCTEKIKPGTQGVHFSDKRANIKEGHLQFLMLVAFKLSYDSKK